MIGILRIKYKTVIPLIYLLIVLCIFYTFLISGRLFDHANPIFLLIQLTVIPVSSFISIYTFNDLFGTKNSLFLFTYYKGKTLSIFKINLLLFMLPSIFICFILNVQYEDFNGIAAIFLLLSQLLLVSNLAFLIFNVTSDFSLTITLFALYISVEVFTLGNFEKIYHLFYLNLYEPINLDNTLSISILNSIMGIFVHRIHKMFLS